MSVTGVFMLAAAGCTTLSPLPEPALVRPFAETPPVGTGGGEDAADDPAIWIHPTDASKSLVFGTDKKSGVYGYSLAGREVQSLPVGLPNNADLRQGVKIGDRIVDLMGASDRSTNSLTLFEIDRETGSMKVLSSAPTGRIEPYGFCMGVDASGWLAIIPYKDGVAQLFRMEASGAVKPVAEWKFTEVMEGCVIDEENSAVFLSEENTGLWRVEYSGNAENSRRLVDTINSGTGLVADVEGVALWRGKDGGGYVVASSQSADRFMVYDRKAPNALRGAFRVAASADGKVDAVTHTDGIDITSTPLGANLPRGLFIAQDDNNTAPAAAQNFKFVDWREVEMALGLPQD